MRSIISGIAVCQVNVNADTDTWADVRDSDNSQLDTSNSGSAQILWRESCSSGTKWAIVRIGNPTPAGGFIVGITLGGILKGSTGNVEIYRGGMDTGQFITAINLFGDVGGGKWAACSFDGLNWYIVAAEC